MLFHCSQLVPALPARTVAPTLSLLGTVRALASGALLLAGAMLLAPGVAGATAISWTSTTYVVDGNSRVGRCASNWASLPCSITGLEGTDLNSTSGTSLPVPGPGNTDTFTTAVSLGFPGTGNERRANTLGNQSGDPSTTVTMTNAAASKTVDNNLVRTIAANGTGKTIFTGEFLSTGSSIDLSFSGEYSLLAFVQQSQGGSLSRQRSDAFLSATFLVEDLTTLGILYNGTLLSDSRSRAGFGISRVDFSPFSGMQAVDLSGTLGNTIKVTLTTTTSASSFAGQLSAGHPDTGVTTVASFDDFSFAFSSVPEPSMGLLLTTGLALLALGRSRP